MRWNVSVRVPVGRTHGYIVYVVFHKSKSNACWQTHFIERCLVRSFVPSRKLLLSLLSPSPLRWSSDCAQWHHPVSGLARLLQGCPELRLGDRSPARLPHQNHLRQVPATRVWGRRWEGCGRGEGWGQLKCQQGQTALSGAGGTGFGLGLGSPSVVEFVLFRA